MAGGKRGAEPGRSKHLFRDHGSSRRTGPSRKNYSARFKFPRGPWIRRQERDSASTYRSGLQNRLLGEGPNRALTELLSDLSYRAKHSKDTSKGTTLIDKMADFLF